MQGTSKSSTDVIDNIMKQNGGNAIQAAQAITQSAMTGKPLPTAPPSAPSPAPASNNSGTPNWVYWAAGLAILIVGGAVIYKVKQDSPVYAQ